MVAGPAHDLLESLAGAIANAVLAHDRVTAATVAVRKVRPPVAYDVDSTGVRHHPVAGRAGPEGGGGDRARPRGTA